MSAEETRDRDANYSAAATLIQFPRPLPLLRGPIPAGPTDSPTTLGPHLLAFPNPQSLLSAHKQCRSTLLRQCDAGVRVACSISASEKCGPTWWALLLGLGGGVDFKEREGCEEREMARCLDEAKGKCEGFAEEKSLGAFRRARVATRGRWRVGRREAAEFVGWVSVGRVPPFLGVEEKGLVHEVTNCWASEFLGDR